MGNFTDHMEALAQGIHASTRDRASAVADIKAGAWRMLSAFNGERRASATRLRSELSADCRARAGHVGTMRQGFRRDHDRMGRDLRQKLTQSAKGVASSVAFLRAGLAIVHACMAKEQHAWLAADRRTRSQAVAKLMEEFNMSHGEMALALAENLTGFVRGIRAKTQDFLGRFRQDIQGAHQVWKNLLFAQTGVAAAKSSPARSRKDEEIQRAKERAQAEAVRRRKAEEEQRAKEARAEKSDDEEKVLRTIQDRPDGISISRIAETVGLPAALVTRLVTELVEQGKVRKNGASRLYFPVRGGRST